MRQWSSMIASAYWAPTPGARIPTATSWIGAQTHDIRDQPAREASPTTQGHERTRRTHGRVPESAHLPTGRMSSLANLNGDVVDPRRVRHPNLPASASFDTHGLREARTAAQAFGTCLGESARAPASIEGMRRRSRWAIRGSAERTLPVARYISSAVG